MSSSDWDPAYEASLLNHWYTLNRILLFITPLIYLFLSVTSSRVPPLLRGYRITLPLLAAFFAFCLFTEAYYVGLPIYVCFFPVRGETYHAKEETRLGIQWKLYLVVGVLAFAAAGVRLRDKIRENQGVTSLKMDIMDALTGNMAMIGVKFEEMKKDRSEKKENLGRVMDLRRRECVGERLMIGAWVVGMCAYCIMMGRNKKPAFGL